jgi:hypothetical protein
MLHHRKIVGNKQVRQTVPDLEILEQVYDLGLDTHVKRAYRLITDYQSRFHSERPGNSNSLSLATTELVWIPSRVFAFQSDSPKQFLNPSTARGPAWSELMNIQRFTNTITNGKSRIERAEGILKHHLEPATTRP